MNYTSNEGHRHNAGQIESHGCSFSGVGYGTIDFFLKKKQSSPPTATHTHIQDNKQSNRQQLTGVFGGNDPRDGSYRYFKEL